MMPNYHHQWHHHELRFLIRDVSFSFDTHYPATVTKQKAELREIQEFCFYSVLFFNLD